MKPKTVRMRGRQSEDFMMIRELVDLGDYQRGIVLGSHLAKLKEAGCSNLLNLKEFGICCIVLR
jgi:hypothetical protein